MTYIVKPELRRAAFLATFTTPLSHHDPAQANRANITSFLRRKMVIERNHTVAPNAKRVDEIVRAYPVPSELSDVFSELSVSQFLAVAAVRQFVRLYNGQGLMDGKARYDRLQSRVEFNAIRANSMFAWWGGMVHDMQGTSPYVADSQIGELIGIQAALAQLVFVEMIDNAASAVVLARLWGDATKPEGTDHVVLDLPTTDFSASSKVTLQVPAFSANSARHEMVREPGAIHLLNALDLQYSDLPDGVAAMLYNGGDLSASAPSGAFALTREIRQSYPLFGLIGGSTKGFILGASNLEVSAWLVTTEYAQALEPFGITPQVSAFDLLDRDEHTRHTSKRVEGSPMPYGFETLIAGTQIVLDFRLRPYATDLEIGALGAAIDTFFDSDSTLGGQSARGYGLTIHETLIEPTINMKAMRQAYESYLSENSDTLRDGLVNGTLTTRKDMF